MSTHTHKTTVAGKTYASTPATVPDPNLALYALQTALAAEASSRASGDTGLQSQVDALTARVAALEAKVFPPVIVVGPTPNIPSSIDPTGQADVTAAMTAWLAGLPAGAAAVMGSGAKYRIDGQVHLPGRQALTVDGNGSTWQQTVRANAPILLLDGGPAKQSWKGLRIVGANPSPGLWDVTYEHNHGIALNGLLTGDFDVDVVNVGGDGYYFGTSNNAWGDSVHVHDCTLSGIGRMGVAITDGLQNSVIERLALDHVGYYAFDIEPNGHVIAGRVAGADNVKFLHCTLGPVPYGRGPNTTNPAGSPTIPGQATGYAFVTTNTSAQGTSPVINNVEVAYNTVTDPAWPRFLVGLFAGQATLMNIHDNIA